MSNECVIFDFETLSQNQNTGVVVSMALLSFSEFRYTSNPYEYEELLDSSRFIKFDVKEQVEDFNRIIDKDTLDWWEQQSDDAKLQLKPSVQDKSITELFDWIKNSCDLKKVKKVYTRGNSFDPVFLENLMRQTNNPQPFAWWSVRDTRSLIEGMTFGLNVNNKFIPDGLEESFIAHNPVHDIAMDVMRMQLCARALSSSI